MTRKRQLISQRRGGAPGAAPPAPLAAGRFVAEGDSLSVGFPDQTPWPTIFAANNPAPTVWNEANGGDSIHTHLLPDGGIVDSHYSSGAPFNVCVVWAGTNDMVNEGRSAAQTLADAETYCLARRATGWKVVFLNCIWRVDLNETTRNTYNSSLSAAHTWCDALVDVATPMGTPGTQPAYWLVDQIHLTTAAYQVVAAMVEAAVRAVV